MKKFIIRILINAVALFAAVAIMRNNGIHPQDTNWLSFLGLALIFGLINALIKPVLSFLTCPLIILTLGLGTLLINTLLFWLAGWGARRLSVETNWPSWKPQILSSCRWRP
jgi:putative membrane protein